MAADTADLTTPAARAWIDRWDTQQQGYLPDREERFTALIDAVAEAAGRARPAGARPGLRAGVAGHPAAGPDPGRHGHRDGRRPGAAGPRPGRLARPAGPPLHRLDLRVPGWSDRAGLDRPADAAVSTTALHWLAEPELRALYAELATVLAPGGVLLNGDHMEEDPARAPTLARLGDALIRREEQRRFPDGHPENWKDWWTAVLADPALAGPVAERERRRYREDHHGSETLGLRTHLDALRAAGLRRDRHALAARLQPPALRRHRRQRPSAKRLQSWRRSPTRRVWLSLISM